VPENPLQDFRMFTTLEPERSEGVSEIVEADLRQSRALEERLEVSAAKVVDAHRVPVFDPKTRS
jgi:hypothetical protein